MTYQNFQESEDTSQEPIKFDSDAATQNVSARDIPNGLTPYSPPDDSVAKQPGTDTGWLSGPVGIIIGLGLGLGLALVLTQLSGNRAPEAEPAIAPTDQGQVATASVTITPAVAAPIRETISASGTVQAFDLLSVSPRAGGLQIEAVTVRVGDRVNAGQVLAELDDSVLRAQIDQAEAQVISAQAQVAQAEAQAKQNEASLAEDQSKFERYQGLFAQGAISEEELSTRRTQVATAQQTLSAAAAGIDSAVANVRSAQAEVSRLNTQLGQTAVIAPTSGIIATKNATVGDTASTGTALFELISGNQLELAVIVPQTQLSQINPGALVAITSGSNKNIQLQGRVQSIDPTLDPQTRQATVKVSLPGSDLLSSGMFLNAEITVRSRQGVVIPASAVQPLGDEFIVYVLNQNNTVTARPVEVGLRISATGGTPDTIEIIAGLTTESPVVVEGASYLQDGDTVEVVDALSASDAVTNSFLEGDS
ncbi:MAG: efflux RND transporter periplasmic adaptor subunit [Cyanobacteria bacterium J06598_3]